MKTSIREIAKLAGVSPTTVSFVLNNKKGVSDETRKKIKQLLEDNGYSEKKRSVNNRTNASICIVKYLAEDRGEQINNEKDSLIISAIQMACDEQKVRVFMTVCHSRNFKDTILGVLQGKYSGIIVIGTLLNPEQIQWLDCVEASDSIVLVVDNYMMHTGVCGVTISDKEVSHIALRYLYDMGIRSVAHLRCNQQTEKYALRQEGYCEAIELLGMNDAFQLSFAPTIEAANVGLCEWLKNNAYPPEAVYADTGAIALGAMRALQEQGFRIPEDVSVVSGEDIIFGEFSSPALTAVSNAYNQMSRIAVRMIMRRVEDPSQRRMIEHTAVRGKLIVRASVKRKADGNEYNGAEAQPSESDAK